MSVDCFGFSGGFLHGFAAAGCAASGLAVTGLVSEGLVAASSAALGLVVSEIINEYNLMLSIS